jgi:plastocyanin
MNKDKLKITYIVIGVIVLVLIIWGIRAMVHKNNQGGSQPVTQNNPPAGTAATSTPTSTPTTGKNLSYGDAVKAYPNRFQFVGCKGTPASMVVKKGTSVMLDNRDTASHTIKADGQTFSLGKYGFAILHTSIVENATVTCDGKNSVTLNVEK